MSHVARLRGSVLALVVIGLLAAGAFAAPSFADTFPDVSSSIAVTQTGGPFISPSGSLDLWVTPLDFTNIGTQGLDGVQFVDTQAWVCLGSCGEGSGPDGALAMTWNNSLQEWQLLDGNGDVLATVAPENSDFALSLDPSSTNIPIPSGFGLSTADSVPAFSVGDIAPSGIAPADVNFLISTNVTTFFFNGSEVGTTAVATAPEPGTLALLAVGLMPLFWLRRKRCEAE
jgi:hypothetical protein